MSVDHYENFPVASMLCPPHIRQAVVAIYKFARTADDIADEGKATALQRRESLTKLRTALDDALASRTAGVNGQWTDVAEGVARAVHNHQLDAQWLHRLLDAFTLDTHNPLYESRQELLHYCALSANPVGRLMLELNRVDNPELRSMSDDVCTALQLINFWQDLSRDLPAGRCYLPRSDALRHGVDISAPDRIADSLSLQRLLAELCKWARGLMLRGAPIACAVPGRMGWELRLVVQGGLRILDKLDSSGYRSHSIRPALRPWDAPLMLWRAMAMKQTQHSLNLH